jgi:chromate reductase
VDKKSLGIFVGSLRKDSFSKKIALHLGGLLQYEFDVAYPEIGSFELYNQDLDDAPPGLWLDFRARIKALDAVLFVTPEYNRSIPPVLKNAIDIASRPYADNAWSGKPGGIVSVSPGAAGGISANHHLRQVAACVNILLLARPEAYIGNVHTLLDNDGSVSNEKTRGFLLQFADAFSQWVNRL